MSTPHEPLLPEARTALELAQTAKARYETTEAAAESYGFDLERTKQCGDELLDQIHRGPQQNQALWVVEIAQSMLTAIMAVNREPLPVSEQVDPASYAMSVLRDLATDARNKKLNWEKLEITAAEVLRQADTDGYSHLETYWALNRATAALELAKARSLAGDMTDVD